LAVVDGSSPASVVGELATVGAGGLARPPGAVVVDEPAGTAVVEVGTTFGRGATGPCEATKGSPEPRIGSVASVSSPLAERPLVVVVSASMSTENVSYPPPHELRPTARAAPMIVARFMTVAPPTARLSPAHRLLVTRRGGR
jgi:hypothetical protein